MAKAATIKVEPDKKKKKKAAAATVSVKVKGAKPAGSKKTKKAKKASAPRKEHKGLEALAKLADHPLVADLLAAGAVAAVAAIAEHQLGSKKKQGSAKVVKAAGQAAASAIGRKLMDEFGSVRDAATDAAKKA